MGPTWDPSGAGRTQVGPMLAPWTLPSGLISSMNEIKWKTGLHFMSVTQFEVILVVLLCQFHLLGWAWILIHMANQPPITSCIIHPSISFFLFSVLSVSHSMVLSAPGYVEHWVSVDFWLVGHRQPGHNYWHQSSHNPQCISIGESRSPELSYWYYVIGFGHAL